MELAALEVPIRAPGGAELQATLRALDQAGQRAGRSLDASARQASAAIAEEVAALHRIGAAARAAAEGEAVYQRRLRDRLAALRGTTQNLILQADAERVATAARIRAMRTTAEATQATRAVAVASTTVAASSGHAVRGIRTLTAGLAQLAAVELGVRSGLGTMASVLGTFALGSTLTLGVVAGLAAIAFGIRKAGEAAREQRQRLEEFREESRRLAASQRNDVLVAHEQVAKALRDEAAARQQVQGLADAHNARNFDASITKLRQLGLEADAERLTVERAIARQRIQEAGTALNDRTNERVARETELRRLTATATEQQTEAYQRHVTALVSLVEAGVATHAELTLLAEIQGDLAVATRQGTAEARAQALALLEIVRAARAARAAGVLGPLPIPRLSATTPPDTRTRALPTRPGVSDEELRQRGFQLDIPSVDMSTKGLGRLLGLDISDEEIALFEDLQNVLDPTTAKLALLSTTLGAGANAWSQFWEAVGSGDTQAFGQIIAGFARQMSALFAQQAAAALALGLTPPPLGNPAFLASVPRLLAVSAGFALLAGAVGGGGGGRSGTGSAGGGRSTVFEDRETRYTVEPRLRPAGSSSASAAAARISPRSPTIVQQTIIGEHDPQAQRAIARMTELAARRGLKVG